MKNSTYANLPAHSKKWGYEPIFGDSEVLFDLRNQKVREIVEAFYINLYQDDCVSLNSSLSSNVRVLKRPCTKKTVSKHPVPKHRVPKKPEPGYRQTAVATTRYSISVFVAMGCEVLFDVDYGTALVLL